MSSVTSESVAEALKLLNDCDGLGLLIWRVGDDSGNSWDVEVVIQSSLEEAEKLHRALVVENQSGEAMITKITEDPEGLLCFESVSLSQAATRQATHADFFESLLPK